MQELGQFEKRKHEHLNLALDAAHEALGASGLERIHLFHDSLPEFSLPDVTLSTTCLGLRVNAPLFIAGMTAGHAAAPEINLRLARACRRKSWAFGLGSMRRELAF